MDPNCKGECCDPFCDAPGFPPAPKLPTCEEIEAAEIARRAAMTQEERDAEDHAAWMDHEDAIDGWIASSQARGLFV